MNGWPHRRDRHLALCLVAALAGGAVSSRHASPLAAVAPAPPAGAAGTPPWRVYLPDLRRHVARPSAFRPAVVGQVGGPATALDVQGDHAFVGVGRRLDVYDVSAPGTPRLVGTSGPLAGAVWSVTVDASAAYVLAGDPPSWLTTMVVVDVGRPDRPRVVGSLAGLPLRPNARLAVANRVVYMLAEDALVVVDASDPRRPRRQADVPLGGLSCVPPGAPRRWAADIDAAAGRLYVSFAVHRGHAAEGGYALGFDLSEPLRPSFLACAVAPITIVEALATDGKLVYLVGIARICAIDFGDPLRPHVVGELPLPGIGLILDAALRGDSLYVLHNFMGGAITTATMISIYDASEPARLRERGTAWVGPRSAGSGTGRLAVQGDFAFALNGDGGHLHVADIAAGASPRLAALLSMAVQARDLATDGTRAVMVTDAPNEPSTLRLFGLADPARPVETAAFAGRDGRFASEAVAVSGDHAYIVGDKLWILDIATPVWPERVASVDLTKEYGWPRVAVANGTATVAAWDGASRRAHLSTFDVGSPLRPVAYGRQWLPGIARPMGLVAAGRHVFLTTATGELHVLEAVPPAPARIVGGLKLGNSAARLARAAGLLVASSERGLHVVDATDPARPHEVGFWPSPSPISAVAAADGYAIVGLGSGGDSGAPVSLQVIDLADPTHPRPARRPIFLDLPLRSPITTLAVRGPFAYFGATDASGLFVLQQRERVR